MVASHGQGDVDGRCRQHLMPYFAERTRAVIEIDPDPHIAEGNVIQHDQLSRRDPPAGRAGRGRGGQLDPRGDVVTSRGIDRCALDRIFSAT